MENPIDLTLAIHWMNLNILSAETNLLHIFATEILFLNNLLAITKISE